MTNTLSIVHRRLWYWSVIKMWLISFWNWIFFSSLLSVGRSLLMWLLPFISWSRHSIVVYTMDTIFAKKVLTTTFDVFGNHKIDFNNCEYWRGAKETGGVFVRRKLVNKISFILDLGDGERCWCCFYFVNVYVDKFFGCFWLVIFFESSWEVEVIRNAWHTFFDSSKNQSRAWVKGRERDVNWTCHDTRRIWFNWIN